jgi:ADP-ribosylglycohydrolase
MLLEIAIGDAYGRSFEFNSNEFIKEFNIGLDYVLRNDDEEINLFGTYTDDTQMSIALAELLIDDNAGFDFNTIGKKFVKTYKRDPHGGYSKRILAAFAEASNHLQSGKKFFNACQTDVLIHSNGSIMRSVPLGILPTEGHVIRAAQMQSLVTHCSHEASMGSQLIAITSHYFYYKKHKGDFSVNAYLKYLGTQNMFEYYMICENAFYKHYKQYKTIPCDANITVGAVINTLFSCKTAQEILIYAISFSGDVDSIAAITLGIASLKDDIIMNFSKNLIINLENKKYGKNYLIDLDNIIFKKYNRDINY